MIAYLYVMAERARLVLNSRRLPTRSEMGSNPHSVYPRRVKRTRLARIAHLKPTTAEVEQFVIVVKAHVDLCRSIVYGARDEVLGNFCLRI